MMKEISMHILDIAQNSIKAEAQTVVIEVDEDKKNNRLTVIVEDDGKGMSPEMLEKVRNPFTTSRTTRKVGLGIPMLEQTCLQCGGKLLLQSELGKGTRLEATMELDNIDKPPMGDIVNSIYLLAFTNPDINLTYKHRNNESEFVFDLREIREILGDVPLDTPDVLEWLKGYITEGLAEIAGK